jgi:prophage regulatory protein
MLITVYGDTNMATNINSKQNSKITPPATARIIRWPKVHDKVDLCRSHVHQLVSKGEFPAPIKITPNGRASGWIESEVDAWVEQRIADSRTKKSIENPLENLRDQGQNIQGEPGALISGSKAMRQTRYFMRMQGSN